MDGRHGDDEHRGGQATGGGKKRGARVFPSTREQPTNQGSGIGGQSETAGNMAARARTGWSHGVGVNNLEERWLQACK